MVCTLIIKHFFICQIIGIGETRKCVSNMSPGLLCTCVCSVYVYPQSVMRCLLAYFMDKTEGVFKMQLLSITKLLQRSCPT